MDLVQALDQTQKLLARRDESDGTAYPELASSVDAMLAHYRERRPGDVAYSEQGADRIDRTGPTGAAATQEKERAQAALIAFAGRPTDETAGHARDALDALHRTMTS